MEGLIYVPIALSSIMTMNIVGMYHGTKLSRSWWKNIYGCSTTIVHAQAIGKLRFLYMIVRMSVENQTSRDTQRFIVDMDILYILRYAPDNVSSHFWKKTQHKNGKVMFKLIRNYVYVPADCFQINSVPKTDAKNHLDQIQIKVYPLSNQGLIYGFEFWTNQWFWGLANNFTISQANEYLKKTVDTYTEFPGIDVYLMEIQSKQPCYSSFLVEVYRSFPNADYNPNSPIPAPRKGTTFIDYDNKDSLVEQTNFAHVANTVATATALIPDDPCPRGGTDVIMMQPI